VGFGEVDVLVVGVDDWLEDELCDGEGVGVAAGVPPPRPVSSQRTPSSSTSRTTRTAARRTQ